MNLQTKITYLKLINGEELISLCLMPNGEDALEEAIDTGFAYFVNLLFPASVSTKRNQPFLTNWAPFSYERTFKLPVEQFFVVSDATDEVKEAYSLFLKEQGIEQEQVREAVINMVGPEEDAEIPDDRVLH